jgi:hypothetical protein
MSTALPQQMVDKIRKQTNEAGHALGFEFESAALFDYDTRFELAVRPLPGGCIQRGHVVGSKFFAGNSYKEISTAEFYGVVDDMIFNFRSWYEYQLKKIA